MSTVLTRSKPRLNGLLGNAKVLLLYFVLATLFSSCALRNHRPPASAEDDPNSGLLPGATVIAIISDETAVRRGRSGAFIEVDDMRFRVDPSGRFAYAGRQWPNGLFTYDLAPAVRSDPNKVSGFAEACNLLTVGSGIRCVDITTGNFVGEEHYAYVFTDIGNHSNVGFQRGVQEIGILDWGSDITIAHEIKHALGWAHEHQRPDRDSFVKIVWPNILADKGHNFEISTVGGEHTTYDFESIMHYRRNEFSDFPDDSARNTIEPLPPYGDNLDIMGESRYISAIDRLEIIARYGETGTLWCGLKRYPNFVPSGCVLECDIGPTRIYGDWKLCGCDGAPPCL